MGEGSDDTRVYKCIFLYIPNSRTLGRFLWFFIFCLASSLSSFFSFLFFSYQFLPLCAVFLYTHFTQGKKILMIKNRIALIFLFDLHPSAGSGNERERLCWCVSKINYFRFLLFGRLELNVRIVAYRSPKKKRSTTR